MSWWVETGCLLVAADLPKPDFDGWRGCAISVEDRSSALFTEERTGMERWAVKRIREFSSGRVCARRALEALGRPSVAIHRRDDRAPIWPVGVTGSITHCDDVAAAVLAPVDVIRCLGLDIECRGRISSELHATLFTLRETDAIARGVSSTLLFAAKEAIYKALHPVAGVFIGFTEMELRISSTSIIATYLGSAAAVHDVMDHLKVTARLLPAHAAALAWLS